MSSEDGATPGHSEPVEIVEGTVEIDDLEAFLERIREIADEHGVTIQAFDARYVADRAHLERAVELARRSLDRGENVADDPAVEILCYAAGRRQIDRALEMGVAEGSGPVAVVVAGGFRGAGGESVDGAGAGGESVDGAGAGGESVDGVGTGDVRGAVDALAELIDMERVLEESDEERLREYFDISAIELEATDASLADLVHERVALLDVEK